MCQYPDDTIEATELERELRDEYVIEPEHEAETDDFEDTQLLADGGD